MCAIIQSSQASKPAGGVFWVGTRFGGEGVREEKAGPGDALWWQIDTLFDLWGRQPPRLPTARGKERWSYLCFMSFSISTLKYAKLTHAITDEFCTSISHLMHNREGQSIQEDDDEHGGRSENHGNRRETERRNWGWTKKEKKIRIRNEGG